MPEYQIEPPYKPPLRPHRLIPAEPESVPAEGLPAAAIERQVESWRVSTGELPSPVLEDGGRSLAEQAWLFIEKAALTIDALPAVLQTSNAPEETFEAVELISSLLLALPDLMASGLENSVARVDWMFSRLLNAPGHPGLVEQVIETLVMGESDADADAPPTEQRAEIGVLRTLHRDLVTLQQRWDTLIEAAFPVFFPPPANVQPGSAGKGGSPADARSGKGVPKAPSPLPAGLTVAPHASARTLPFRAYAASKHQQRLAVLVALVLLVVVVLGLLLVHARSAPAITPGSAALSVDQRTPPPTTSVNQPTATPTLPTPTPPQPTPTTQPTPGDSICPQGAAFCISTLRLQVPCAGRGSVSFQLIGSSRNTESWQTLSIFGDTQVTLTPTHGTLKINQKVTISVWVSVARHQHSGTIMIFGPVGTAPIGVTAQVCS